MAFQETTRQSYGSKVKNSFQGILWGIILIIAGTVILWWNEGRAVKASDALKDFQKNYVELSDISTIDPAFEGKAVHATGVATTNDTLRDAAFGIAVNAMKLVRNVEYYQWTQQSESERKDKLGGSTETTTTYTYEPAWCSEPVNSNEFKDPDYKGKNFVLRAVEELEQTASDVTFGAYRLTPGIVGSISGEEPAYPALTDAQKKQLLVNIADSTVVVTVSGDQVYIGSDPAAPHIGDVRITFTQVTSPKTISLLQKVVNNTFESYIAKNGKSFSKVEMGTVSAENMIEHQKSANKMVLWLFRILGIILVVAGFRSLVSFLSTVFAVVPFVQRIIGAGVGFVATVVGIVWSAIVIGIAWIAHRPLLGITLLVVAAALIVWLVSRSRKKKTADVIAILMLVLALGLGTSCKQADPTGTSTHETPNGETLTEDLSMAFKGPVKSLLVTTNNMEGDPYTVKYSFDPKGKLTAREEYHEYGDEGDSEEGGLNEALSEKDAQGRYVKEVYGTEEEGYTTYTYEYTADGKIAKSQYWDTDGTLRFTTTYGYDAAGNETSYTSVNPQSTFSRVSEYDSRNRIVKAIESYDGQTNTIQTYQYDVDGWDQLQTTEWVRVGRTNLHYEKTDKEGSIIASRNIVKDEKGTRLTFADTTFTDAAGYRHERYYYNQDEEYTQEGTFNKQGNLTRYALYRGQSTQPSITVDFDIAADGETLNGFTARRFEAGQVQEEKTARFGDWDSFGNWTTRALSPSYLISVTQDEDLENFDFWFLTQDRTIQYYGDDQGQNYGFEGSNGDNQLRLQWTRDHSVLYGEATLDGQSMRIVGTQGKEESGLHIVALEEDGTIPWHIYMDKEGDKRMATIVRGMEELKIPVSATRKGLKTYHFSTTADAILGLYEYHDAGGDTGDGTLRITRSEDDPDILNFEISNCGPGPSYNMATDTFTDMPDETLKVSRYLSDDDYEFSFNYQVCLYDGFAVILRESGSPMAFFGLGMSVTGIYAKVPAAE